MSGRRGAHALLAGLTLLVAFGLLVRGLLPIGAHAHRYADARSWLGIPNSVNVLVNLPLFWLAVWGWCATRVSAWPRALRLPWQSFHLCVMAAALAAAMYHAAPGDMLMIVSRACQACAFALLALGLLAERVDRRFGSAPACAAAAVLTTLAGLVVALTARQAGVADAPVLHATGWISGHTLMHVGCAGVVGWMAYRAAVSRSAGAGTVDVGGELSQLQTSLNTTG